MIARDTQMSLENLGYPLRVVLLQIFQNLIGNGLSYCGQQTIWAESTKNEGSIFRFTVPVQNSLNAATVRQPCSR